MYKSGPKVYDSGRRPRPDNSPPRISSSRYGPDKSHDKSCDHKHYKKKCDTCINEPPELATQDKCNKCPPCQAPSTGYTDNDGCDHSHSDSEDEYHDSCHCKKKKKKKKLPWPPKCKRGPGTETEYKFFTVGKCHDKDSDFESLDEAIEAIKADHKHNDKITDGYIIALREGPHQINTNLDEDIPYLRLVGDYSPARAFHGVGYVHQAGQWCGLQQFDTQYNSKIGGIPNPWLLSVSNCGKCLHVKGSTNPNFNGLMAGDKIMFQSKDGNMTEHKVCRGSHNTIWLEDPLCDKEIEEGEGFFTMPRVEITTCRSQIMKIEGRMEGAGICWRTDPTFTWGSTGESTEMEHSVIMSNGLVHVGNKDWYKPNVTCGQIFHSPGFIGTSFLQTILGPSAFHEYASNGSEDTSYNIISLTAKGHRLRNGAKIASAFTDYICNAEGIDMKGNSVASIPASRFIGHGFSGISATSGSQITADPPAEIGLAETQSFAPVFVRNNVGFTLSQNSNAFFTVVKLGVGAQANLNDVVMDNGFPDTPPGFLQHTGTLQALMPAGAKVPNGSASSTIRYSSIINV